MSRIIVAYIPVLHDGYKKFIKKNLPAEALFLWGKYLQNESDYLEKEIRALSPELVKKAIDAWDIGVEVKILDQDTLNEVVNFEGEIIMPDDDISHDILGNKLKGKNIIFDNIFLRWDRRNSIRENKLAQDQVVTSDEFSKKMIVSAEKEAEKSSDWWRHVGAIVVKEGKIIFVGHNHHVPSDHTPYVNGDPRNSFHKGEYLEFSTAVHAEAGIIAEAARKGVSLEGTEIYVTTFPCPPCAKLIAYSGIKKIYYGEGYGTLDGEDVMKSRGVEIVYVDKTK